MCRRIWPLFIGRIGRQCTKININVSNGQRDIKIKSHFKYWLFADMCIEIVLDFNEMREKEQKTELRPNPNYSSNDNCIALGLNPHRSNSIAKIFILNCDHFTTGNHFFTRCFIQSVRVLFFPSLILLDFIFFFHMHSM